MLFAPSAQKTLANVIRDYRQGELTNPPGGNLQTKELKYGHIYVQVINGSNLTFAPGDIVPLTGEGCNITNNAVYTIDNIPTAALFNETKNYFFVKNMQEEYDDSFMVEYRHAINVIPFGIAQDFITSRQAGQVQVDGFAWVPFEDIPELQSRRKYVILRRNSRHEGQPFLQAAADGTAEIIHIDDSTPCKEGFTWGLVKLGAQYRGSLSYMPEKVESTAPNARAFFQSRRIIEDRTSAFVHGDTGDIWSIYNDLNDSPFKKEFIFVTDHYDSEKRNFVRTQRIEDSDPSSWKTYLYIDRGTGKILSSFLDSEEELTAWPDFIKTHAGLKPFTGGFYPARCKSKTEIVVLGRTLQRSELFTREKNVDIWPGDEFYVHISNNNYNSYANDAFIGPYELVGCPKDDPVGTKTLSVDGSDDGRRLKRGWVFVSIHQKFKDTHPTTEWSPGTKIGVLTGGDHVFKSYISQHRHSNDGDVAYSDPGWDETSEIHLINVFENLGYWEKVEGGMTFD